MNDQIERLRGILGEIMADKPAESDKPRVVAEYIDGQWQLIPTEIGGKRYEVDQAIKYLKSHDWVDPHTNIDWSKSYPSQDAAESAMRQRQAQQDPKGPRAPAPKTNIGVADEAERILGDDEPAPSNA